jgi:hemoglobin
MIKKFVIAFCMLTLISVSALAQKSQPTMNAATSGSISLPDGGQDKKSLYTRLGGYDAIALVVDDFITRLATDKRFEKFFTGFSDDSKKRLRQHILDQFCAAAGGLCVYTGREMRTSHKGLGITEADWDAAAKHLVAALDKYKVPEAEKNELLAFVVTQKKDIVEK